MSRDYYILLINARDRNKTMFSQVNVMKECHEEAMKNKQQRRSKPGMASSDNSGTTVR